MDTDSALTTSESTEAGNRKKLHSSLPPSEHTQTETSRDLKPPLSHYRFTFTRALAPGVLSCSTLE